MNLAPLLTSSHQNSPQQGIPAATAPPAGKSETEDQGDVKPKQIPMGGPVKTEGGEGLQGATKGAVGWEGNPKDIFGGLKQVHESLAPNEIYGKSQGPSQAQGPPKGHS